MKRLEPDFWALVRKFRLCPFNIIFNLSVVTINLWSQSSTNSGQGSPAYIKRTFYEFLTEIILICIPNFTILSTVSKYFPELLEFLKILLLSETDMPDRRPRHASSETDMPNRRPKCPIRVRHAPLETDMPAESNRNFNTFKYSYYYILFAYLYILE